MTYREKTLTLAEAWPDHAGHKIIYSEHGRTDYLLQTVIVADFGPEFPATMQVGEYDNRPTNGEISDSEFWCNTCGIQLPDEYERGPT